MSLIDALKQNLGPAHVSWVNDLDDWYTLEDVDAAVSNKGMFVDHRENKGDSSGRAAYPAADQADARVRGYGIAFCGAMYGCSLMYLSLDPVLCDTTVDECDC